MLLYLYILYHLYVPTIFARRRQNYSSASDSYPLHNKRQVFVRGRIPSPNHEASIRSLDEYPLQNMGQLFVPRRNTLSKKWGKYSFVGRIPSSTHGASIRTTSMDQYPHQEPGASTCPWTNSTYSTHGFVRYSSNLFVFVRVVHIWYHADRQKQRTRHIDSQFFCNGPRTGASAENMSRPITGLHRRSIIVRCLR